MHINQLTPVNAPRTNAKKLNNQYSYSNINKSNLSFEGAQKLVENKALYGKIFALCFPEKTKLYELTQITPAQLKNNVKSLQETGLKMLDEILTFRKSSTARISEVLKENNAEYLGSGWAERVKGLNYEQRDELYGQTIKKHGGKTFTSNKYPDLEFDVDYYRGEFLEKPYPYISNYKDKTNISVIGGDGKNNFITNNAEFNVSDFDLFDTSRLRLFNKKQDKNSNYTEFIINHATKKIKNIKQKLNKKIQNSNETYDINIFYNNKGKASKVIFKNSIGENILEFNL